MAFFFKTNLFVGSSARALSLPSYHGLQHRHFARVISDRRKRSFLARTTPVKKEMLDSQPEEFEPLVSKPKKEQINQGQKNLQNDSIHILKSRFMEASMKNRSNNRDATRQKPSLTSEQIMNRKWRNEVKDDNFVEFKSPKPPQNQMEAKYLGFKRPFEFKHKSVDKRGKKVFNNKTEQSFFNSKNQTGKSLQKNEKKVKPNSKHEQKNMKLNNYKNESRSVGFEKKERRQK